jgi:hypothetical protein
MQVLTLNPYTVGDVLSDIARIRQALGQTGGDASDDVGEPQPYQPAEQVLRARVEAACKLAKELGPPKLRNVGGGGSC